MRLFILLIVLLSPFAATASAQVPDTTATAVDTTAVVAPATTPPPTTPPPATEESGKTRRLKFGAGVHYMETIGDIQDAEEFDSSAINALVAVKLGLGLITIEGDSEWSFDYGGSDHTLWLPQLFGLVGRRLLYAGAGIGGGYLNGEWFDRPVYTIRAGVNVPLGPVVVDVNANYQFMNSRAIEGIDSEDLDSITFGAVVWF